MTQRARCEWRNGKEEVAAAGGGMADRGGDRHAGTAARGQRRRGEHATEHGQEQ